MTERQLVYDTLEFRNPPRAPRQLWTLKWADLHYPEQLKEIRQAFPSDIAGPNAGAKKDSPLTCGDPNEIGEFTDAWGCVFVNRQRGVIGEVKSPQITGENWEDAKNVRFPVEWLDIDAAAVNESCKKDTRFLTGGCCPRPFEQLQFLRGSEQLYMDLALRPSGMMEFIARLHRFYCDWMEAWAKTDVDALNFMDDWGAQRSLLINPSAWREIFKPMYKDYIDIAHHAGKKIFMHSDGYTMDIIPDLIELGLDALNTQIFCMGIPNVAKFAGKITFWGEIDRQHLLSFGTVEQIEAAVADVKKYLWKNGGCIAQCEFGAGAKPENVRRVFEAWDKTIKTETCI